MATPLTESVKSDFNRIMGMIDAQIDACPDTLWNRKAGGWVFWQQLLHIGNAINFFIMHEGYVPPSCNQELDVCQLKKAPTSPMSKAELKAYLAAVQANAITFLDSLTSETLLARHEALSQYFKVDVSNQASILKLVWHGAYHFGCCDALLREEGLPGIF